MSVTGSSDVGVEVPDGAPSSDAVAEVPDGAPSSDAVAVLPGALSPPPPASCQECFFTSGGSARSVLSLLADLLEVLFYF